MSIEDDEHRRHKEELGSARMREERSRAARNNALERGYMRPDLAGPSIDRFYKNHGIDALRDRFNEESGPSLFGLKRGNPFTREGRAARADANEARRDLPDLWDHHAQDRKNRDAIERAYAERYGPQHEQANAPVWPQPEMQNRQGMEVTVELLVERVEGLEESIEQIESQIERAIQELAEGRDLQKTLEIIAERRKTQLERMFQLGEAHAQIEELENRLQEHDEREQEHQPEQEQESRVPAREDHLDWLRPALEASEPNQFQDEQRQLHEGEKRMLEEMQREGRRPEDYLDWLKR